MRIASIAAAVLAIAGSASAATLTVGTGQTHTTIGSAAGVAADGDTIVINKGRYHENVVFTVPNLTIIGKGAILDGNVAGTDGICLDLTATNIKVTGLSFRNGSNQIRSTVGDLTVEKCTFIDSNSTAVSVTSGGLLTVTGCRFYGAGSRSIQVTGNDVTVQKCWVRSSDNDAVELNNSTGALLQGNTFLFVENDGLDINTTGNGAQVLKNKFFNISSNAVDIDPGNDVEVIGNTVTNCEYATGIYVAGTSALIEKNKLTHVGGGIECYGNDAEILFNKVVDTHEGSYYGIEVEADNLTIRGNSVALAIEDHAGYYIDSSTVTGGGIFENNKVTDAMDGGFYLGNSNGIYNVVIKNCSARNCGTEKEEGFYLSGNNNVVERVSVSNHVGPGIAFDGNGNSFTSCTVKAVSGDGIRVYSGDNNDINNCSATGCGADGFDNNGTNTAVSGGRYQGERFDIVNRFGGGATMTLLNVNYTTGGTTTANEDD